MTFWIRGSLVWRNRLFADDDDTPLCAVLSQGLSRCGCGQATAEQQNSIGLAGRGVRAFVGAAIKKPPWLGPRQTIAQAADKQPLGCLLTASVTESLLVSVH